jgi:hypothetical protein
MKITKTLLLVTLMAVTFACGYSSKSYPPAAGTVPAIAQLSPDATTAGGTAFTLTVMGSNFGSKAIVNWNGAAQTTTYMSGTELTVAIPASLIANAGTVQITVTNPAVSGTGIYGSGGTLAATSSAMTFTIN